MARIDAQGQQQWIERHLHHPSGGEGITPVLVGHAYQVNALRQALKQGRDRTAHEPLPSCRTSRKFANQIANQLHGTAWHWASQTRIIGLGMANQTTRLGTGWDRSA